MLTAHAALPHPGETLQARYVRVRNTTLSLCDHLEPEDYVVQSMPDVSPVKWHLAHTTWFFERFVLEAAAADYCRLNDQYHYLFNSYYYTAGTMHARPQRGLLSRPTVKQILDYREHVDDQISRAFSVIEANDELKAVLELGLHHEQQHQELLLTDIKHVFSCNPLQPAVHPNLKRSAPSESAPLRFMQGASGVQEIGTSNGTFHFDNESPRHQTLLQPHEIAARLVTCAEFRDFIQSGGYSKSDLWLSDGWATINERGWQRPLYWSEDLESEFTLGGLRAIDWQAPVTHISYYEADAFARWAGARLPTEAEWELAAGKEPIEGNLMHAHHWHPAPCTHSSQFFGDVWEWTASSYTPYPGFRPLRGSLGEYNGKFMCNQMTVRGGSCVTADDHIRATYRSFFYPDARWQFLGVRLARDTR